MCHAKRNSKTFHEIGDIFVYRALGEKKAAFRIHASAFVQNFDLARHGHLRCVFEREDQNA